MGSSRFLTAQVSLVPIAAERCAMISENGLWSVLFGFLSTMTLASSPNPTNELGCAPGAYTNEEGAIAALATGPDGRNRYTLSNGARGLLGVNDAPLSCHEGVLVSRNGTAWQPVELHTTRTTFDVGGAMLVGELIEPAGVSEPPLVILAHGSEDFGWLGGVVQIPYLLAANEMSVFIFDKRGTGLSTGEFTMNFDRLARDLAAASREAKRVADGRYSSFGLIGFSQGGWVAPLAAQDVQPDFVVINYGLVMSPQEEDAEEVQLEMRAMGYDAEALSKARMVTDATGTIMIGGIERGLPLLQAVRAEFRQEPWFDQIRGEFTGRILAMTDAELVAHSDVLNRYDIEYDYDALAALRELSMPTLWIDAGEDREAPPELTLERLRMLRDEGRPIEIAVFPDTDHGIVEFEMQSDGTRLYGNHAYGYLALLSDWSRGCLASSYGRAEMIGLSNRRDDCV